MSILIDASQVEALEVLLLACHTGGMHSQYRVNGSTLNRSLFNWKSISALIHSAKCKKCQRKCFYISIITCSYTEMNCAKK